MPMKGQEEYAHTQKKKTKEQQRIDNSHHALVSETIQSGHKHYQADRHESKTAVCVCVCSCVCVNECMLGRGGGVIDL